MTKLKVGDKLYDYSLTEYTVSKIGRRYVHLEGREGYKVDIRTMRIKKYNGEEQMYADRQVVADEKEASKLKSKISSYFAWQSRNKPTLNQLRRVNQIIDEKISENEK